MSPEREENECRYQEDLRKDKNTKNFSPTVVELIEPIYFQDLKNCSVFSPLVFYNVLHPIRKNKYCSSVYLSYLSTLPFCP
jgi:hypothetical protein